MIKIEQIERRMMTVHGNFHRLMTLLGFEGFDYCGSFCDGALRDFQNQVSFALTNLQAMPDLDSGVADVVEKSLTGMLMIHMGLREGYFTEYLERLQTIVTAAIELKGMVVYS